MTAAALESSTEHPSNRENVDLEGILNKYLYLKFHFITWKFKFVALLGALLIYSSLSIKRWKRSTSRVGCTYTRRSTAGLLTARAVREQLSA